MSGTITNAADLISNINAGASFEATGDNQVKKQGLFSKLWQSIGDALWRSAEQIEARQAKLDEAMANILRGNEPLPNLTQQSLINASHKLPTAFESTLAKIQKRLDIAQFPKGNKAIAQTILAKTGDEDAARSVGMWRNSDQIPEKDMQKFCNALKDEMNGYMKNLMPDNEQFNEDIANQLYGDAGREIITIGGNTFQVADSENGKNAIDHFKNVIQDKEARRFVSSLMCQTSLGSITTALSLNTLTEGKGFVPTGLPKSCDKYIISGGSQGGAGSGYATMVDLKISGGKDGHPEKATITHTQKLPIQLLIQGPLKDRLVGNVNVTLIQECKLGKNPSISDIKVKFSYEGPNENSGEIRLGHISQSFKNKLANHILGIKA